MSIAGRVHCPHCGARLGGFAPGAAATRSLPTVAGHASCLACRRVEWRGPLPVAGVLLVREGRVLLVRCSRSMERAPGMWAYPGGFVESGESAEGAALRETLEEAGLRARITGIVGRPHTLLDPHHVVVAFRGEAEGEPVAGEEAEEVRWFAPDEIPWDEIAFPSTEVALRALAEEIDGPPRHAHEPAGGLSPDGEPPPPPRRCRRCGGVLRAAVEGEAGALVCAGCGVPWWSNPAVGASLLAVRGGRVLLGRRAVASRPGFGLWAGPAGYLDPAESAEDAAVREIREETGVRARVTGLISVYSNSSHIEVSYFGETGDEPRPTAEMSEVRWFARDEVPWGGLFDTCGASVRTLIERGVM